MKYINKMASTCFDSLVMSDILQENLYLQNLINIYVKLVESH